MRCPQSISISVILPLLYAFCVVCFPAQTLLSSSHNIEVSGIHNVSVQLFSELEEFARIVDIAYCVGVTGIYPPFECASRCSEFPGYQLVDTWNTGPLMSDSCGYLVLDHNGQGRIIVAFRGTYSVANTIVDLSTIPQEYVPYPGDPDEEQVPAGHHRTSFDPFSRPWNWVKKQRYKHLITSSSLDSEGNTIKDNKSTDAPRCDNCTVHMGFYKSWTNTRPFIIPHLERLHDLYPTYSLHLVGHSLGGAVAALASLECEIKGWNPTVTTFGEPRIGNIGLRNYLDEMFHLRGETEHSGTSDDVGVAGRYRRLTHTGDPVPLLPLTEWSFAMHGGEIYISKSELQPGIADVRLCDGDEDSRCIYGEEIGEPLPEPDPSSGDGEDDIQMKWGLPARYRMWQLFFAHRDYFWRLGLCVPGGDPADWGRRYDNITDGDIVDPREL